MKYLIFTIVRQHNVFYVVLFIIVIRNKYFNHGVFWKGDEVILLLDVAVFTVCMSGCHVALWLSSTPLISQEMFYFCSFKETLNRLPTMSMSVWLYVTWTLWPTSLSKCGCIPLGSFDIFRCVPFTSFFCFKPCFWQFCLLIILVLYRTLLALLAFFPPFLLKAPLSSCPDLLTPRCIVCPLANCDNENSIWNRFMRVKS